MASAASRFDLSPELDPREVDGMETSARLVEGGEERMPGLRGT